MPTPGDYQEAIQNPLNTINDDELKVCTPEVNKLGIPFGRTGNFAVTYKMIGNGKKYALKCFTREASDLCKRYDLIHRFLEEQESEYFIDFHYLDNAILIDGEWLPILKMEWVENGELITKYIEKNLNNKKELNNILEQLFDLATYLEKTGLSHGDLQAGNIIVVNNKIKLIDYDGMHVPGMTFSKSNEIGHENFQHPKRDALHVGEMLDRFSSIVFYLGIKALTYKPRLWEKYYDDVDIMIKKSDFLNAKDSKLLLELSQIDDMKEEIERFQKICEGNFEDIPHITDFLAIMSDDEISRIKEKYTRIRNLYILPLDYSFDTENKLALKKFDSIPEKRFELFLLWKEYDKLVNEYVLPIEILNLREKSMAEYDAATEFIRKHQNDFLTIEKLAEMDARYILPDELQKDFLQNTTKENYIETLRKIEKIQNKFITKREYSELKGKYLLPNSILKLTNENSEDFIKTSDNTTTNNPEIITNKPWYMERENVPILIDSLKKMKDTHFIPEQVKNSELEDNLLFLNKYKDELLTKEEYLKLGNKYFLPFELKYLETFKDTNKYNLDDFIAAVRFVRKNGKNLIKKSLLSGKPEYPEENEVTVESYDRLKSYANKYTKKKKDKLFVFCGFIFLVYILFNWSFLSSVFSNILWFLLAVIRQ